MRQLSSIFGSVLALALVAGAQVACAPPQTAAAPGTLEYTENARTTYERGVQAYVEKNWEEAMELFREVKRKYGQSRYGKLAELRIADIAFAQDKLAEAISTYKTYVQAHRNDPDIPYAQFRVCKALFQQINDTMLLPPQEERDQSATSDAYRELLRFKKEYVQTKWDQEINFMLQSVTGRLVRHEIYVARFYLRQDRFDAAVGRIHYALRSYEGSGLEPEAIVLLGETYLKMKKNKEAREAFDRVLLAFPESPFTVPAKSFIAQMDATRK